RNIVPKAEVLYSMKFEDFKQLALNLKNLPLPGEPSHHKMAPEARIQWMGNNPKAPLKARKAGVMAIFYPDAQGRTRFLLILRNVYEGVHSGQIGFPGGKWEEGDRGILDTALRETWEEVGIPKGDITVIRELSELYIPPSNFLVRPFLGLYPEPRPFVPDQIGRASCRDRV